MKIPITPRSTGIHSIRYRTLVHGAPGEIPVTKAEDERPYHLAFKQDLPHSISNFGYSAPIGSSPWRRRMVRCPTTRCLNRNSPVPFQTQAHLLVLFHVGGEREALPAGVSDRNYPGKDSSTQFTLEKVTLLPTASAAECELLKANGSRFCVSRGTGMR